MDSICCVNAQKTIYFASIRKPCPKRHLGLRAANNPPMSYQSLLARRAALAQRLHALSQRSSAHRHLAYWLAGLADWVWLLPRPPTNPASAKAILGGYALVLVALCFVIGPVLRILQPVFVAMGRCPGWALLLGAVLLVNAWRYAVGRRLLHRMQEVTVHIPE